MRRGFKTWCEEEASRFRKVLGQKEYEALTWEELSSHLEVPVVDASVLNISDEDRQQLYKNDPSCWDAFTLPVGEGKHMVFYNSNQPSRRNTNTIMHELAHLICKHVPTKIVNLAFPVRTYDPVQEDEADWLAGSLLLPRTALLLLLKKGMKKENIADQFQVSMELLQYRINMTGVLRQVYAPRRW
jgi:Zn-dependent peptidase ImmA (M78 family)